MEEKNILEATERFLRGEMSSEEIQQFHELRNSSPDIDQLVAEYTTLFAEIQYYGRDMAMRSELSEIEKNLKQRGLFAINKPRKKTGHFISTYYR